METLTARRTFRQLDERLTAFHELQSRRTTLGLLLATVQPEVQRVYLCGDRPGAGGIDGVRSWASELPAGWSTSERGHYLEGEHPVIRVVRPDGREVELLRAAVYFGEGDYTARDAGEAWTLLGDELRRGFDKDAVLLSSPAATGRELWLRTIPRGVEWPTVEPELQSLIRATTGQGRIEILPHESRSIPELVGYDGRMMYGALCRELPAGRAMHRRATEFLGHTRARYSGRVQVPRDWRDRCACGAPGHPELGLLPFAEPDPRDGWSYPSEPGRSFAGWWDGAELLVALAHGWRFAPATAIVFAGYRGAGPLDGWATRMLAARDRLALLVRRRPSPDGEVAGRPAELAGRAVRAIVLHSIGAFHGSAHRVTRSLPLDRAGEVPADARDLRTEGESIVWAEYDGAGWPALSHPEWSSAIWARARARLLDCPTGHSRRAGALTVDSLDVIAMRTDAVYLARDPGWPDDGRAGRLRRQTTIAGPLPAPSSHAELLELTR